MTVSVLMITYNHQDYIRQAIEGVLMQETSFDFELIIANDNSPDDTNAVVNAIIESHPKGQLIKYINRSQNVGMQANFLDAYSQCKGMYIANCEGDDYWTDPLKLQKQVDFLEANPDYVLCFHKVKLLQPNGEFTEDTITQVPENYETIENLAQYGNYIHTPSVVYRNCLESMPKEFAETPVGDYFLYMLLAQYGKIKYINETMTIYRHGVGVFSGNSSDTMLYKSTKTFVLIASALRHKKEIVDIMVYRVYRNLKFYSFQKNGEETNTFLKLLNTETNIDFFKHFLELYLPFVSEKLSEKNAGHQKSKSQRIKFHLKEIIKTILKK